MSLPLRAFRRTPSLRPAASRSPAPAPAGEGLAAPASRRGPLVLLALAILLCGCTRRESAAAAPPDVPPDLAGLDLMVLPAQRAEGGSGVARRLDAEIQYWAGETAPELRWAFPPELRAALERNPTLDVPVDALPVGVLGRSGLTHAPDPLLGHLRRLGAVVGRRYALVPVEVARIPAVAAGEAATGGMVRLRVKLTLLDTMGGRILWRGAVAGEPAEPDDGALIASAGRAIARRFLGGM